MDLEEKVSGSLFNRIKGSLAGKIMTYSLATALTLGGFGLGCNDNGGNGGNGKTGPKEWNVVYDKGYEYNASDIAVDSNGNVFVVGFGDVLEGIVPGLDILIIKYDNNGNELLDVIYDSGFVDTGYGIAIDNLDNVYITGSSPFGSYNDPLCDFIIIKYDNLLNKLWEDSYDSSSSGGEYGMDVAIDNLGDVYVTGYNGSADFMTIKYDKNGNRLWDPPRFYDSGSGNFDYALSVAVDNSGNVYVGGWNKTGIGSDSRIVKYDSNGLYQGEIPDNSMDIAEGIAVDSLGNIIVTGYLSNPNDLDVITVKYDGNGAVQPGWPKTFDSGFSEAGMDVAVDDMDNIYVGARSNIGSSEDYLIIKYDSGGNKIWNRVYDSGFNDTLTGIDVDSEYVYITGTGQNAETGWPTIRVMRYKQD